MKNFWLILILIIPLTQSNSQQYQRAIGETSNIYFANSNEIINPYLGLIPPDTIPKRFGTPELISNGSWWWHSAPVFSPDGTEMFFVKYIDNVEKMEMYEMVNNNGQWTAPFRPSFISDSLDNSPVFLPGGDRLMFMSKRTGTWKFYQVFKTDSGWSSVQDVNFDYNSLPGSLGKCSAADDGSLYFSSKIANDVQICKANLVNGVYTQFEILPAPLNSASQESLPFIAPDQSYILFVSNKTGSIGQQDIYISFHKTDGSWTIPQNMGNKINGTNLNLFPIVSPDGKYIFFVSLKQGDIAYNAYWVSSDVIKKLNPLLSADEEVNLPSGINLYQNYPNPFNPSTTIKYSITNAGNVKLVVYNVLGSLVSTLLDEYKPAGSYSVQFNGIGLTSGIYFYRLQSGNCSSIRKLVLVK